MKDTFKKIWKVAALIFIASFMIINWNDISWIFNYKEMSGLVGDFFNPYPSINATAMEGYFYPNHSQNSSSASSIKSVAKYTDKQNTLEIPKISISVPIIFSDNANKDALLKSLNQGVVYYPGSVYPGQTGQAVILGHSAPPGWPKVKHDWVFTNLEKLEIGDSVIIHLNSRQYIYKVKQKTIIKRGAEAPVDILDVNKNILTLISCWPPGKDYQRIAVQAELVNG